MRSVVVSLVTVVLLAVWMIARDSTSLESRAEPAHPDIFPSVIQGERAVRSEESRRDARYESAVAANSLDGTSIRKVSNVEERQGTKGRIAALEREIEGLPVNESRRRVLEELLEASKAAVDDLVDAGMSFDDAERIAIMGNDNYFSCIRAARAEVAPNLVDQEYVKSCALIMLQQTGLSEFPATGN
jgi:hypothetical protein